jgi:lipopolysaccharide transport system ATP-binding protein
MAEDAVIEVSHVSKKYCKSLNRSMLYGIKDITKNTLGLSSGSERLRKDEFWAVDDVSFELKKGEVLGIIGPNGSGKTTILQMLNGIFWPDKGKITVKGRVGALIAVGAGFHPLLTGRENIYLNAAIMGMTKKEVDKRFVEIVEFSGIGDFIDSPVKFYSSGMFVRLGFAIAVHCEPDILLVDEILAVGDLAFRVKCYNKLEQVTKDCAVIIVSHNMSALSRIAGRCIVFNKGRGCFHGSTEQAIQHYYALSDEKDEEVKPVVESSEAKISNIRLQGKTGQEAEKFCYGEPMTISFDAAISSRYKRFLVSVTFSNQGREVAQCNSKYNRVTLLNDGCMRNIQITIPNILLNTGIYTINLTIFDETHQKYLYWNHNAKMLKITDGFAGGNNVQLLGRWKMI